MTANVGSAQGALGTATNGSKQVRKKPDVRTEEILSAAVELLVRDGYAAFSLRQVAKVVGVRLATLQYYFPTRESLLSAAITRSLHGWRMGYSQIADDTTISAAEKLRRILQRNLDYVIDEPAAGLLFEAFAMAKHESFAAGLLSKSYVTYRKMFVALFIELRPDLQGCDAMAIATVAASHTEGVMIFATPDDPAMEALESLRWAIDAFAAAVIRMVESAPPAR